MVLSVQMGPSVKQTSANDKLFMSGLAANVAPTVSLVSGMEREEQVLTH